MFTAVRVLFSLFGVSLTDTTIRLILIVGAIVLVVGLGFYFHHEIENWLGERAYKAELAQASAVNQQQLAIANQNNVELQKEISDLTASNAKLKEQFDGLNGVNNHIKQSIAANKKNNVVSPLAGPITQQTIKDLAPIWAEVNGPSTVPTKAPVGPVKSSNPSIEEWLHVKK